MTDPAAPAFAEQKPCRECRKGPAFRLDVERVRERKNIYRCRYCGMRWRLVTVLFRSHHEPAEQLPGIGKRFKR